MLEFAQHCAVCQQQLSFSCCYRAASTQLSLVRVYKPNELNLPTVTIGLDFVTLHPIKKCVKGF